MRAKRETLRPLDFSIEDAAIERDRELERQRAAAEDDHPAEHQYDFSRPLPGMMAARETAALPWGYDPAQGSDYSTMVERLLSRVWHVLYTLGEQMPEIVRLRENTRQILARLSAT
jgi:hypothetical protein